MEIKLGKCFPEVIQKNIKSFDIQKLKKIAQIPNENDEEKIYKINEIENIVPEKTEEVSETEEIEEDSKEKSDFKTGKPTPFIIDNFMRGRIPGGDIRGKHSPELKSQREQFIKLWEEATLNFAKNVLGGDFSNITSFTKNYLPTGTFIEFLYKKNDQIISKPSSYERINKKADYETDEQYQNRLNEGLVLHYGFILNIIGPTMSGINKGKYAIKILDMTYSKLKKDIVMNMTDEEIEALQIYQPRVFSLDRMYNVRYSRGSKKTPYLGKLSNLRSIRLAKKSKIIKAYNEDDFNFNDYIKFQNFLTKKQLYLSIVESDTDPFSDRIICVLKDYKGVEFHPELFKGTLKELVEQYKKIIRSMDDEKIQLVAKNKRSLSYKNKSDFDNFIEFKEFLLRKNLEMVLVDPLSPHTNEEIYLLKNNNTNEIFHPEIFHGTLNDLIKKYLEYFHSLDERKINLVAKKVVKAYKDKKEELFFEQLNKYKIRMVILSDTNNKFALYTSEASRIPIRNIEGKIISGTLKEIIDQWFELPRNKSDLDKILKEEEERIVGDTYNIYEFDESGKLTEAFKKRRLAQNQISIDNDTSVNIDLPGNANYTIYINNIIDKALKKLQSARPDYLKPFTKIVNKSSGGQWYGRVSSDSADVIEIDVNRIVNEVQNEIQNQIVNQPDIDQNKIINPEELMELASNEIIKQVESIISHETGHNIVDKGFNESESEAERRQKEIIDLQ